MTTLSKHTPVGTRVSLFDMVGTFQGFRDGIKRSAKNYCDGTTINLTRKEAVILWDGTNEPVGCEEYDVIDIVG